ncbi:MAG: DNA polymerase Y family protein [Terriglobales bacterium]
MFACIFIPDFSVQAIIRFEPELRARSVAVLTGRPPLEKVVALNESARQTGVEIGATKSQLEAWENLVLRARSVSQETSAHAALLDCAQSFSPEVEDTAPGTVLLNLAGLEPLLGPLPKIARNLAQRVSQMGLEANLAVAANPDAALLAARGFPGVTLISEGREAEQLGDLPVDVLLESFSSSFSSEAKDAARWAETFDRWGIRKLRALAALPEVPVSERLGQQGLHLQKLARGAASRNLRVLEPRLIFAESVELEYPIVLLEPLAFLLNRMLEQVCSRLRVRALAAQELHLHLELAATQPNGCASFTQTSTRAWTSNFTRTLRLPAPMLDAKVFLKLLQLDLQAHPPGAPIVKIHLSADPARPRALQSGLFQPVFPEPEKLELTLARIAGIVGEGRVGSVELLDTHREGAFALRHFAPGEPAPAEPETKHEVNQSGNRKQDKSIQENNSACQSAEELEENAKETMSAVIALRLFRPPLGASVTVRQAKPVRMRCLERDDIAGEIVWTAGPWRSSGDWSEQEGWSREEWDIAVLAESSCQLPVPSCPSNEREPTTGNRQPATRLVLYRLVQDKLSGNWFVEGMYD